MGTVKEIHIAITAQDLHKLYSLHEDADELEKIVSRCYAMVDVLSEAVDSMNACGYQPEDPSTISDAIMVIRKYGLEAKYGMRKLEADLSELHKNTSIRCMDGGVLQ